MGKTFFLNEPVSRGNLAMKCLKRPLHSGKSIIGEAPGIEPVNVHDETHPRGKSGTNLDHVRMRRYPVFAISINIIASGDLTISSLDTRLPERLGERTASIIASGYAIINASAMSTQEKRWKMINLRHLVF